MTWFYQVRDGLTHVRVFMNGFYCGKLYFSAEQFQSILDKPGSKKVIEFKAWSEYSNANLIPNQGKA